MYFFYNFIMSNINYNEYLLNLRDLEDLKQENSKNIILRKIMF